MEVGGGGRGLRGEEGGEIGGEREGGKGGGGGGTGRAGGRGDCPWTIGGCSGIRDEKALSPFGGLSEKVTSLGPFRGALSRGSSPRSCSVPPNPQHKILCPRKEITSCG